MLLLQAQSKSVRVLDMIAQRGGMRRCDIQRALWEMSHPGVPMRCRGYWNTNLGYLGLLETYCYKGTDGLWHRNEVPHHGKPWAHPRTSRARKSADAGASTRGFVVES